ALEALRALEATARCRRCASRLRRLLGRLLRREAIALGFFRRRLGVRGELLILRSVGRDPRALGVERGLLLGELLGRRFLSRGFVGRGFLGRQPLRFLLLRFVGLGRLALIGLLRGLRFVGLLLGRELLLLCRLG